MTQPQKLAGIPSTYGGWQVQVIADATGALYISQLGKMPRGKVWAFRVWRKATAASPTATLVLTLTAGNNASLSVVDGVLYAVEIRKGGSIWLNAVPGFAPLRS
jgi:hypothetical protein